MEPIISPLRGIDLLSATRAKDNAQFGHFFTSSGAIDGRPARAAERTCSLGSIFEMPKRATIEAVRTLIQAGVNPPLVAIDGLPCAGKTTLASRLSESMDFECIYLDEFVLPEKDWPSAIKPAFPFAFIRYAAFLDTVQTLASRGTCTYHPFDWDSFATSADTRTVGLANLVVVEGVSSLHPSLCDLYGLRIFVESDRATTLQAAFDRGGATWADHWRELFLPSADIYMESEPQKRADLLIAGRGM